MKYEICVEEKIMASIHRVWDVIARGSGVDVWFPEMIRSCHFDADTKIRNCVMTNGATLDEKIILIDAEKKLFRYMITNHPLSATNLVATISLRGINDSNVLESTAMTWRATFETNQENAAETKKALTLIYESGCKALTNYLGQQSIEDGNNA